MGKSSRAQAAGPGPAQAGEAGATAAQVHKLSALKVGGQDSAQGAKTQVAPVLPWMRVPILIEAGSGVPLQHVAGLDPRLQHAMSGGVHSQATAEQQQDQQQCREDRRQHVHYQELFPVQSVVWNELAGGTSTAHDLCIAAPTGSGKTLAYALPVVNGLARPAGCCRLHTLQALVVLPTRDLAVQVHSVFAQLCPPVGLTLGLAAAQASQHAEAQELMGGPLQHTPHAQQGPALLPGQHALCCPGGGGRRCVSGGSAAAEQGSRAGGGPEGWGVVGQGCVDVLVATPGRLMAHLTHTPGFNLDHLKFLVVDETDRLLRQSYQEWLPRVLGQLRLPSHYTHAWASAMGACSSQALPSAANPLLTVRVPPVQQAHGPGSVLQVPMLGGGGASQSSWRQGSGLGSVHSGEVGGRDDGEEGGPGQGGLAAAPMPHSAPRPVKVVVSATLTRDPSKLQRLELHCPRYIATSADDHRYHLPRSLQEFKVLCSGARKPLTLIALLQELRLEPTIVFASSLETTHKLYLLLQQVMDSPSLGRATHEVVEYSSHLSSAQRASALAQFRIGRAKVLVASDAMTRGMDVDNVHNVVNYDAPVYAKTYVHRAGRTARAGRSGRVFTLLRDEDVRHFKQMLRKADNTYVKNHKLAPGAADSFKPALEAALKQVQELLEAEAQDDTTCQRAEHAPKLSRQQQQQQQQKLAAQGEGELWSHEETAALGGPSLPQGTEDAAVDGTKAAKAGLTQARASELISKKRRKHL